jgi:hypothetical protein
MIYYQSIFLKDYLIPDELEYRFVELNQKLRKLSEDSDHNEAFTGYKIVFQDEFKPYLVNFKKGDIWEKQTEEWLGNAAIGTKVKIVSIQESFIYYKHIKEIFGYQFGTGYSYCLNKWSFLRIFRSTK